MQHHYLLPTPKTIEPVGEIEVGRIQCTSRERFICKAIFTHGNKFDYSKVDYVSAKKHKVTIVCKKHGEFEQLSFMHLRHTGGCKGCSAERKQLTLADFIQKDKKIHGEGWDYSQIVWVDRKTKIKIGCPVHGFYYQSPTSRIYGKHGCKQCAVDINSKRRSSNLSEFMSKANFVHEDRYDYSKSIYINSKTPITIICPDHGEFYQKPNTHLHHGCPKCGWDKKNSDIAASSRYVLYHLRFKRKTDGFIFHKIGIRAKSNKYRFSNTKKYGRYEISTLVEIEGQYSNISNIENTILNEMSRQGVRYKLRKELKNEFIEGWTECFDPELFDPTPWFIS